MDVGAAALDVLGRQWPPCYAAVAAGRTGTLAEVHYPDTQSGDLINRGIYFQMREPFLPGAMFDPRNGAMERCAGAIR